ncbi:SH2 domain-containing protein [Heterostelium album PN500]|uniref:SH2 domain-containing protein n=1 Tax=Heterostelium pallidum (strain ATCC 26659 / Pp 5 / PN500) TaxID=670386 RepID=D3B1P0_HETP5|nr:SH2 domain-containing protein [Heterostelium album PN500]EFA85214.1 SH2 domain-containing protein [Heterostelium album PN500]|eukprot:XP_020437323.1 SH2 domain-containing protein [Heterostelium album PN500]
MSSTNSIDKLEKSILAAQEEIKALESRQASTDVEINSLIELAISHRSSPVNKERLNSLFTSSVSSNQSINQSIQDLRAKASKIQSVISLKQELVNCLINTEQHDRAQDIWNQLRESSFKLSPNGSKDVNTTSVTVASDAVVQSNSPDTSSITSSAASGLEDLSIKEEEKEITKWEIDKQDIIINRDAKIGAGAFGSVFKGSVRGKEVAIKKLTQQFYDETVLNEFRKEVCLMTKLRNPHLLLFMGACTTQGNLSIVTELMPKGSVHALLKCKEDSADFIDFKRAILIARDTSLGMNWLHLSSPPILHLDLKPANLLVDNNWVVKVADFGLSKIKKEGKSSGQAGSPLYMSPEMLLNREYDEKSDVYSFSMLLWEMLTKLEPYNGFYKNYNDLVDGVTNKKNRPTLNENWGPRLKDLLIRCWDHLPNRRPSFEDITRQKLLDHILIEGVLSDGNARQFWTHNFLGREEITWNQFYTSFCTSFGVDMKSNPQDCLKIKCLKLLLVSIDSESVKIEDFGRFLGWFGPLNSGNEVLERVLSVCSLKGFLGETSSKNVIQFLANKKSGTYIVRFSSTDPGCYALSYVSKNKDIAHAKIIHKPGHGYIHMGGSTHYPSLDELIKNTGKLLGLKDPFEGGQFYALIYASKNPQTNHPPAYVAVAPSRKV